jgi:hypothetical protein
VNSRNVEMVEITVEMKSLTAKVIAILAEMNGNG